VGRGAARRIARARVRSSRCISRRAERWNAFRRRRLGEAANAKPPGHRDAAPVRATALPGRGRERLSRRRGKTDRGRILAARKMHRQRNHYRNKEAAAITAAARLATLRAQPRRE